MGEFKNCNVISVIHYLKVCCKANGNLYLFVIIIRSLRFDTRCWMGLIMKFRSLNNRVTFLEWKMTKKIYVLGFVFSVIVHTQKAPIIARAEKMSGYKSSACILGKNIHSNKTFEALIFEKKYTFCKYLVYFRLKRLHSCISLTIVFFTLRHTSDQANWVYKLMTKDWSTKIVISMTPWTGVLVLGHGHKSS